MKPRPHALPFVILLATLLPGAPARGVIAVPMPVSKVLRDSQTVLIGTVARVIPDRGMVDVRVGEAVKGKAGSERVRLLMEKPAERATGATEGRPVVVFVAKPAREGMPPALALVHVGDAWRKAFPVRGARAPIWRVGPVEGQATKGFPGRTAAVVAIIRELLKTGRTRLLDKVENKVFQGGVKRLARLDITAPRALTVADVNGDGKGDLLIDTAKGCRLFLASADGYRDATQAWCPWGVAGGYSAFGDVNADGRIDYLQNSTLWIHSGAGFSPVKSPLPTPVKLRPLAAALTDATGDGKPDAVHLAADGTLRVHENSGGAGRPWRALPPRKLWRDPEGPVSAAIGDWGDDTRPHALVAWPKRIVRFSLDPNGPGPAEYTRLTGLGAEELHKAFPNGLTGARTTTLDINADRRPDWLVLTATGGLLLVNRGYGAFLANQDAGIPLLPGPGRKVPFALTPATRIAAADLHGDGFEDLLILTEDGTLYEADNTPFRIGAGRKQRRRRPPDR